MTQSIRDAAQALIDCYDDPKLAGQMHQRIEALVSALSAPQPTADERVAEHMALVCDYGNARANNVAQGGRFYYEAEQAAREAVAVSARALLSASQDDADHAAMYRWLRDNKCNSMHLTRNGDHACNYMTASQWIDENPDWFDGTSKEELEKMKETNTIWDLQIYPNTPVGFNVWSAATLDAAIRAAMSANETKE